MRKPSCCLRRTSSPTGTRRHKPYVEAKKFSNILLAFVDGTLVGTNFLTSPRDKDFGSSSVWQKILGRDTSAYGCLGVREDFRGCYIGYALAVRADDILRARGARTNYLAWVFSSEWYGRLGYRVWREYQEMSTTL